MMIKTRSRRRRFPVPLTLRILPAEVWFVFAVALVLQFRIVVATIENVACASPLPLDWYSALGGIPDGCAIIGG